MLENILNNAIGCQQPCTITCDSPIKTFTNKNYKIKLTIFAAGSFTIGFSDGTNTPPLNVCDTDNVNVNNNGLKIINLEFTFDGQNIFIEGIQLTFQLKKIIYAIRGGGVGISLYVARLIFPNTDPENFSLEGTMSCHSTINPCIPGFTCAGGVCQKCDASCLFCEFPNSSTSCITACNRHASTQTPQQGQCSLEYIDLSQFNDIIVNNIDPPRTNRLTVSFWIFDATKAGDGGSKTITIPNYLEVTINLNDDKITCQDLFSRTGFVEISSFMLKEWNYVKCSISNDIKKLKLNVNNYAEKEANLVYPEVYTDEDDNLFNKYFYRLGETITMNIEHTKKFPFYIRNLYLFQEYVPESIMHTKYYALDKFVGSTTLPEILFSLPFDNLSKGSYTYTTKAFTYITNKEVTVSLTPTTSNPDFNPPKSFQRLNLLTKPNIRYSSSDLFEEETIPVDEGKLFVDEGGNPFSCLDSLYLNTEAQDNICQERCPDSLLSIAGVSYNKGICYVPCNGSDPFKCEPKTEFSFLCEENYFKMFYTCLPNTQDNDYVFYYNSKYTPGRIILDFSMYKLKSIFIEFLFYVDNTNYKPQNDGYIFYSNIMRLKQNGLLNYIWVESTMGPPRKYYSLTEQGLTFLQELEEAYGEIERAVNFVKNTPMKECSINSNKIISK